MRYFMSHQDPKITKNSPTVSNWIPWFDFEQTV